MSSDLDQVSRMPRMPEQLDAAFASVQDALALLRAPVERVPYAPAVKLPLPPIRLTLADRLVTAA
jgi:hypothetical protein